MRTCLVLLSLLCCLFSSSLATDDVCHVRFIHGCTALTGPLDLSLNGAVIINAQSLATISAYVDVDVGIGKLSVSADVSLDVELKAGTYYTIAVVGDLKASIQVFIDNVAVDVQLPLVRVALLAPLNLDLNVYLNAKLLGLLKAHAELSVHLPYQTGIEGTVTVAVKNLLGIDICAKVFAAVKAKAYTVYLIPSLSANAVVDVLIAEDIAISIEAKANIRLLHGLIKILPAIDLAIDGNVVVSGASYGLVSAYVSVNVGQVTIQVRIAGTNTVILELPGVALVAGNYYTICVFGETSISLKILLDSVLAIPTGTLARVGHLVQGLVCQVVSLVNKPLLNLLPNPVCYKDVTNFLTLTADAKITLANSADITVSADVSLVLGSSSTKLVIGSPNSKIRPLVVVTLTTPGLNINLNLDLALKALLNIRLDLLKVNVNLLGLNINL